MFAANADSNADDTLPALREELKILPGSALPNGAPSWMIYDPVQSLFFKISADMFAILSLWAHGTATQVIEHSGVLLGRVLERDEVEHALHFFRSNCLTQEDTVGVYSNYYARSKSKQKRFLNNIVKSYLFFKIPLVQPQRFLQQSIGYIGFLFSKSAFFVVLLITLFGIYLVTRQWDSFVHQFTYLFNFSGLVYYFSSLVIIKILHELGHAYTAVRYGCRVSSMGIGFMVMMPLLYTDTTDAWRLQDSKKRAVIDAAGMIVELSLAGIATFVWVFLDDGPLRSAVFALASSSWLLSLLVNLNPFMRFDGYYLLADTLGVDNLQPRSFALSKWYLREVLFKLNAKAPEGDHKLRSFMICYGFLVWIYRLFLFIGIALLVYAFFFKVLGIILFVIEVIFFVALPVYKEISLWWQIRSNIMKTNRSRLSAFVVLLLVGSVFVPWAGSVYVPVVLEQKNSFTVYPKNASMINNVHVSDGQQVQAGDVIISLHSPQLDFEFEKNQLDITLLQERQARGVAVAQDRDQSIVIETELLAAKEHLAGLQLQRQELEIKAPFDGVISGLSSSLQQGLWVGATDAIATLVGSNALVATGYVGEQDIRKLSTNSKGVFVADDLLVGNMPVELLSVSDADNEVLSIAYLDSAYGGSVATELDAKGQHVPVRSSFVAQFSITDSATDVAQVVKGVVKLQGVKESLAKRIWRSVARVSVREMGV